VTPKDREGSRGGQNALLGKNRLNPEERKAQRARKRKRGFFEGQPATLRTRCLGRTGWRITLEQELPTTKETWSLSATQKYPGDRQNNQHQSDEGRKKERDSLKKENQKVESARKSPVNASALRNGVRRGTGGSSPKKNRTYSRFPRGTTVFELPRATKTQKENLKRNQEGGKGEIR